MTKDKDNEQWGNLGIGDLSAEELLRPDINKVVANRRKAKDETWLKNNREAKQKEAYIENQSNASKEVWQRDGFKTKMSNVHTEHWANNDERRDKVSKQMTELERTDNHCNNISSALKERYKDPEFAEQKQKQLKAAGSKISAALKGRPKPKRECPYCKQMIAANVFNRFHNDNCKAKK